MVTTKYEGLALPSTGHAKQEENNVPDHNIATVVNQHLINHLIRVIREMRLKYYKDKMGAIGICKKKQHASALKRHQQPMIIQLLQCHPIWRKSSGLISSTYKRIQTLPSHFGSKKP